LIFLFFFFSAMEGTKMIFRMDGVKVRTQTKCTWALIRVDEAYGTHPRAAQIVRRSWKRDTLTTELRRWRNRYGTPASTWFYIGHVPTGEVTKV
jgi:hypothetical protein